MFSSPLQDFLCLVLQVVEVLALDPSNHVALTAAGLAQRVDRISRRGCGAAAAAAAAFGSVLASHLARVRVYLGLLEHNDHRAVRRLLGIQGDCLEAISSRFQHGMRKIIAQICLCMICFA